MSNPTTTSADMFFAVPCNYIPDLEVEPATALAFGDQLSIDIAAIFDDAFNGEYAADHGAEEENEGDGTQSSGSLKRRRVTDEGSFEEMMLGSVLGEEGVHAPGMFEGAVLVCEEPSRSGSDDCVYTTTTTGDHASGEDNEDEEEQDAEMGRGSSHNRTGSGGTAVSSGDRLERRKEQNRRAAQTARMKKKTTAQTLQSQISALTTKVTTLTLRNTHLETENKYLHEQNDFMKNMLSMMGGKSKTADAPFPLSFYGEAASRAVAGKDKDGKAGMALMCVAILVMPAFLVTMATSGSAVEPQYSGRVLMSYSPTSTSLLYSALTTLFALIATGTALYSFTAAGGMSRLYKAKSS